MNMTIAVIAIVVTAMVIVAFVATRRHPETAATHGVADISESTALFGRAHDRPGGPGAESDGVPEAGAPAPGPSAESLGDGL